MHIGKGLLKARLCCTPPGMYFSTPHILPSSLCISHRNTSSQHCHNTRHRPPRSPGWSVFQLSVYLRRIVPPAYSAVLHLVLLTADHPQPCLSLQVLLVSMDFLKTTNLSYRYSVVIFSPILIPVTMLNRSTADPLPGSFPIIVVTGVNTQ